MLKNILEQSEGNQLIHYDNSQQLKSVIQVQNFNQCSKNLNQFSYWLN